MNDLTGDLEYTRCFLDDILVTTSGSFDQHLEQVREVLTRLERANFRANVKKCSFAATELDYLGFWLTRDGFQPQPKKVEAILRLKPPKTKRQLRHFLGMVNFYRDMWRRRSHLLAPLTGLVSPKAKWEWGEKQQSAFEEVKKTISQETLLNFPDFNKEFHIYTDASDYQLGAVIMQDNKPLAFYSRKLTPTQKRYTTGEQELLSIVETVKELRNILLGQQLIIHTDHKNILYGNMTNDRIARWRLALEEYGPEYRHIPGKENVVADALSRMDSDETGTKSESKDDAQVCATMLAICENDESKRMPNPSSKFEMAEAFATNDDDEQFPMSPRRISREQRKDNQLQDKVRRHPQNYDTVVIEGEKLIKTAKDNRIVIPSVLQTPILAWYHEYLRHPGETRMIKTLQQIMTWPSMTQDVGKYVRTCPICQKNKKIRKKYGHLPPKEAEPEIPWNRVNVDLIGPYTVKSADGKTHELRAMTMIDPATGWFEIKDIKRATAEEASAAFDDVWLSRYPRPQYIGFDNGGEFKNVFNEMSINYGLKRKPSTAYNPQSNGIVERVHQCVGDILRSFELDEQELDPFDPWSSFLAATAYAIRSTYHTTLQATPSQLVFGRDMLLPVKFKAEWESIRARRQQEINRNAARENRNRVEHHYQVGDKVLLQKPGILRKMSVPRTGPHTIERVYTNGTVRIRKRHVRERVNIRRIIPYFEREQPN